VCRDLFVLVIFRIFLCFAWLRRSEKCHWRRFAFVVLGLSPRVPPARPRGARSSGDGGDKCSRLFESGSGVAYHEGDPLLLPPSSSTSELSASWSFLLLFVPLLFVNRDRHTPCQRERGSKFSRRPQRSCSVEVAKLVSHVYDSVCSAVGDA